MRLNQGCPLLPSPPPGYALLLWGPSSYKGPTGSLEEKDEYPTAGSRELGNVLVSEDSMMAIHTGTVFCCLVLCSGPFLPRPLGRMGQPATATFSALLCPCPGDVKGRRSDSSLSSYTILPVLLPFQCILSLDCEISRAVRETK